MSPEMGIVVVIKPTVCTHWKAAVLSALGQEFRTPPGSESGACFHRGNSGTWESHLSPCHTTRSGGPGDQKPWRGPGCFHQVTSPEGIPQTMGARKVSGNERQAKDSERGRRAVVAAHSTGEGGEARPKRPTGGKAPSSRASAGRRQGRDIELTNPDHGRPVDCGAREALRG